MTLTKDELARLAELEDLLTVGLVEQPINGSVLSWGEAALIAHRIGRHLLRDTPVADTAGIDALRDAAQKAYDYLTMLGGEWSAKYGESPTVRTQGEVTRALAAALRTPRPEGER